MAKSKSKTGKKTVSTKEAKQKLNSFTHKKMSQLFQTENRFITAVVLVSIVVFAFFIILLDASITGMVVQQSSEDSNMDNLFFVMTVFGMVLFLGSMLFYYLNSREEYKL